VTRRYRVIRNPAAGAKKGIATNAVAALLAEVKERPLHGVVSKGNAASRRVLEKCGFTVSSELRETGAEGEVLELLVMKIDA